jgi:hypothetical protein
MTAATPYRGEAGVSKPPPTETPTHVTMSGTFDRLVDSNLALVRMMRAALVIMPIMVVGIAVYSTYALYTAQKAMSSLVTIVIQDCKRR